MSHTQKTLYAIGVEHIDDSPEGGGETYLEVTFSLVSSLTLYSRLTFCSSLSSSTSQSCPLTGEGAPPHPEESEEGEQETHPPSG